MWRQNSEHSVVACIIVIPGRFESVRIRANPCESVPIRVNLCESVRIRANPTGRAVTGRRHVRDITGVTQCTVQKMSKVPSIKLINSNEKSSWMTLFRAHSDKVKFLTRWPWRWPCMTLYHIYLKSIWTIKLNDTLHNSIWKIWILTFVDLEDDLGSW